MSCLAARAEEAAAAIREARKVYLLVQPGDEKDNQRAMAKRWLDRVVSEDAPVSSDRPPAPARVKALW